MLALPVPPVRLGFHSRSGTKVNFTDITPDMDLAGCKMHIVNTASTTGERR